MNHKIPSSRIHSAQLRLTPKAGSSKSPFNAPVYVKFHNQMSPPCTPRSKGDSLVKKISSCNDQIVVQIDNTKSSTNASVEDCRGKLLNHSSETNVVNGIHYHRYDQLLSDNSDIMEDNIGESKVSNETIKVTANLSDGKRKVKIKNVPKWNGQQVYDPFSSYHGGLDKDTHTGQALGKVKKLAPLFGLTSNISHVDSNKKQLITPVDKNFYANQLSPPLTPRNRKNSFSSPSQQRRNIGRASLRRPNFNTCVCLRPLKIILCTNCEYEFAGRIRKTCKPHPNDNYELDVVICPKCKVEGIGLKECEIQQDIGNISNKLISK